MSELQLGKPEEIYAVAPAYVQRAVVVAVASFICFLAMMAGFYLRQNVGYFFLSTAFLIVYIFTMIGLLMMKRNVVNVCRGGISYRKFSARWDEIESVQLLPDKQGRRQAEIRKKSGEHVVLSDAIQKLEHLVAKIKSEIG